MKVFRNLSKKLTIDDTHALQQHAPTNFGFLDMLSGFWGSITRKVFLPFRRGSRLPPSPSSTWYALFKCSSVSSVMWTRLLMIVEKDRCRGSHLKVSSVISKAQNCVTSEQRFLTQEDLQIPCDLLTWHHVTTRHTATSASRSRHKARCQYGRPPAYWPRPPLPLSVYYKEIKF